MKSVYLYLCNKKHCGEKCPNPDCEYTTNPNYSKNPAGSRKFEFQRIGDMQYFVETEEKK